MKVTIAIVFSIFAGIAHAQNPFAPVIQVNQAAITAFEIEQRQKFLSVVGTQGDLRNLAIEELIDERLKMQEVRDLGMQFPPEAIEAEMAAFASRGRLSVDEFAGILAENDVDFLTFKDFSTVRFAWRELIRARFGRQVNITEEEVDRALALSGGGLRVLVSELVIRANSENLDQARAFAEDLQSNISSQQEFTRSVRRYSASPTRENDGKLEWLNLSELPAPVAAALLGLRPGEISAPVQIPGGVALFQMRATAENRPRAAKPAFLDFLLIQFGGLSPEETSAQANLIRNNADRCEDVWAFVDDLPEEATARESLPPSAISPGLLAQLERLDPNEFTPVLASGGGQMAMLCARSPVLEEDQSRDTILQQLRSERFEQIAESYLSELRAAAQITGR